MTREITLLNAHGEPLPARLADPPPPPEVGGLRLGASGQEYAQGVFSEEYHDDLSSWTDRIERFEELRRGDALSVAQLERLKLPIIGATWAVEPGEGLPLLPSQLVDLEVEEDTSLADRAAIAAWVVESNLMGRPAVEHRMATTWRQFLHEALTFLDFGVSVFERTWTRTAGPWGEWITVEGLWWIHPRSIAEIRVDRNGGLVGIKQKAQASWWEEGKEVSGQVEAVIPKENLVVFVRKREGANWEGTALLRHVYASAKRRGYMARLRIVDAQRRAAPPPHIKLLDGYDPKTKDEAEIQARRLRSADELAWAVSTPNVELGFLNVATGAPDLGTAMTSEEEQIRAVVGTEFTTSGGGSLARASVQADYFNLHVEAVAGQLTEEIGLQIIRPLAQANFPDASTFPEVRAADVVPRDIEPIARAVGSNLVEIDGEDEQAIRSTLRLPPLTAKRVAERTARLGLPSLTGAGTGTYALVANTLRLVQEGAVSPDVAADMLRPFTRSDDPYFDPSRIPDPTQQQSGGAAAFSGRSEGMAVLTDFAAAGHSGQRDAARLVLRAMGRVQRPGDRPAAATLAEQDPAAVQAPQSAIPGGSIEAGPREVAFVDLPRAERFFDAFETDFRQAVRPVRDALVDEAVKRLVFKGAGVSIPRPNLPRKGLEAVITEQAEKARTEGQESVTLELKRQVALYNEDEATFLSLVPPRGSVASFTEIGGIDATVRAEGLVATSTEIDVNSLLRGIVDQVQDEALRAMLEGATEEEAREQARRATKDGGGTAIGRAARKQASVNFNAGRLEGTADFRAGLEGGPLMIERARRIENVDAGVKRDERVCDPCLRLHGTIVDVDSPDFFAKMPPSQCEGGSYCRGFYDMILEPRGG